VEDGQVLVQNCLQLHCPLAHPQRKALQLRRIAVVCGSQPAAVVRNKSHGGEKAGMACSTTVVTMQNKTRQQAALNLHPFAHPPTRPPT